MPSGQTDRATDQTPLPIKVKKLLPGKHAAVGLGGTCLGLGQGDMGTNDAGGPSDSHEDKDSFQEKKSWRPEIFFPAWALTLPSNYLASGWMGTSWKPSAWAFLER
jgi:hypothetical protein